MVKQSRRQVKKRSLRRRTAKKRVMKRRAMKGGVYEGPGNQVIGNKTYNRMDGKNVLYELTTYSDGNGKITYTLDFTKSTADFRWTPDPIIKYKYKDIFKTAFKVTSSASKDAIDRIIDNLFHGGLASVKNRQLEITDKVGNIVGTIKLIENGKEIDSVNFEKGSGDVKFEDFLKSLKDEIMPAPAAPVVLP